MTDPHCPHCAAPIPRAVRERIRELEAENARLKGEKVLIFGVVNFSYSHGKLCPSLPLGMVTPDTYNPEASQKAIDQFFSTREVNSDE